MNKLTRRLSKIQSWSQNRKYQKWKHWVATFLCVFVLGLLVIPILRTKLDTYICALPIPSRFLAYFSIFTGLTWVMFSLHSPRPAHLSPKIFFIHPPIWLAWLLALSLVGLTDLVWGIDSSGSDGSTWNWFIYFVVPLGMVAGMRWFLEPSTQDDVKQELPAESPIAELLADREKLEKWIASEKPSEIDLLGTRRIAKRLATILIQRGGSIGLLGAYGSGKSTVITWLKHEAESMHKEGDLELIFVSQSCWGFEDSGSAIHQLLSKATEKLSRKADCFSLRSLPESYRKTFSVGGDWVRTLSDLFIGNSDPVAQFGHISQILESLNSRLVIVIEDLDRTTSTKFDRQEILALLQRLRETSTRISFVLATGRTTSKDIDFAKICDHIEILPTIEISQVETMIRAVRDNTVNSENFLRVVTDENPWAERHTFYMSTLGAPVICEGAAGLLNTPRAFKHALRLTSRIWAKLRGEVDYDHLLAVNILRCGAPEAFDFLLQNYAGLRQKLSSSSSETLRANELVQKRLIAEWEKVIAQVDWDPRSAQIILFYLIPTSEPLLTGKNRTKPPRIQGINEERYFLRIINEHIDEKEILDQTVLSEFSDWKSSQDPSSILVSQICNNKEYGNTWSYLATHMPRDTESDLKLSQQILDRFNDPQGMRVIEEASQTDPERGAVFIPAYDTTLLFLYSRNLQNMLSREWLERQIQKAMVRSLVMVNDLYQGWSNPDYRLIVYGERHLIRQYVLTQAKELLRDDSDLSRICHPSLSREISRLVFPHVNSLETQEEVLQVIPLWQWLGPILYKCLSDSPKRWAREVAYLVEDKTESGEHHGKRLYRFSDPILKGFFGDDAINVCRMIADVKHNFSGKDREMLDQFVEQASRP